MHHKFTDTDADPYNARRGFVFSHVGWLMIRKHPDVLSKGSMIDCTDLERDPIIVFQRKYVEQNSLRKLEFNYKLYQYCLYCPIFVLLQMVRVSDNSLLRHINIDTLLGVERGSTMRVASSRMLALLESQYDLCREFRGSHMGIEAIR